MYEFICRRTKRYILVSFIGYVIGIFYYLFMLNNKINAELFFFILLISMLILMLIPIFNEKI